MPENRGIGRQVKKPSLQPGKNFLLAIGIDTYAHCPTLKNAVKDATDLAGVLETKYGFQSEHITLITNEEASEYRIFAEFRKLIQQVKSDDNVLIFFSGHGHYDSDFQQGYWIPVDARAGAIGDYIPNSEISTTIRAIPSRHTFMIADACFSGSLFGENRSVSGKETPYYYHQKVGSMTSRWGLASGRNEIVSDGAPGHNSPFTENLLYFLTSNTQTPFTVSELVQYVKTATANNSEQTPIGSPLRNVGDKGGEYIFFPEGATIPASVEVVSANAPFIGVPAPIAPTRQAPPSKPNKSLTFQEKVQIWLDNHVTILVLIAFSTFFGGLWSTWLFGVIPLLAVGIIGVSEIFKLRGPMKIITSISITAIGVIQFAMADRNNLFEKDKDFWESFAERTQNFEFLWFSLGVGCFLGFLYFYLRED